MAKIPVYDAPDRFLHTEEKGFSAFETAGRRIGPAYDAAATAVRDVGRTTAQVYKERLWPWDILEIQQNQAANAPKGGGIRIVDHGARGGSGNDDTSAGRGARGGDNTTEGNVNPVLPTGGAIGRLGRVAAKMVFPGPQPYPANKRNPYSPYDSTPYGYKQPPPIPGPTDALGNPIDESQYGHSQVWVDSQGNVTTNKRDAVGGFDIPREGAHFDPNSSSGFSWDNVPIPGSTGDSAGDRVSRFGADVWQSIKDASSWLGNDTSATPDYSNEPVELPDVGYGIPDGQVPSYIGPTHEVPDDQ